jgi:putative cell wall-binding protein/lipoprotein-anchoring transpeptidase ErfK/SrfK
LLNLKKLMLFVSGVLVCLLFSGKAFAESKVDRLSGNSRYETASFISSYGWKDTSDCAILATGENFPDALSAASLAKKYNAPILLTERNSLNTDAENEIKRLKVKTVYISGGTGAISFNIDKTLEDLGVQVVRLSGSNRYETSVKIAENLGDTDSIFVATGSNFPDALSAASIAASKGMPIILVSKDSIDKSVQDYLMNHKISKTYVIGGEAAISSNVLSKFPNAERICGNDRYETSTAILNRFKDDLNFNSVYFCTGLNFPDALSGSALASIDSSPVVLVSPNKEEATQKLIESNASEIKYIKVLGGEEVLPFRTINNYIDLRKDTVINFNINIAKTAENNSYKIAFSSLMPGDIIKISDADTNEQLSKDIVVPEDKNEAFVDNFNIGDKNIAVQVSRGSIQSSTVTISNSQLSNTSNINEFNSGLIIYDNNTYKIERSKLPQSMKNFSKISLMGFDDNWNKNYSSNIESYNDTDGIKTNYSNAGLILLYDKDGIVLGYYVLGSNSFLELDKNAAVNIDSSDFLSTVPEESIVKIKNAISPIIKNIQTEAEATLAEIKRIDEIARVKSLVKPSIVYGKMKYSTGNFKSGQVVEVIQDINNREKYYVYSNGTYGLVNGDSVSIGEDFKTNTSKMSKSDLELYANISNFSSSTKYFIWVDLWRQQVNIFNGSLGHWKLVNSTPCASGKNVTPTIRGKFTVSARGKSFGSYAEGALYWVRFYGNYMLHSILVDGSNNVVDGTMDIRASHGCIRLPVGKSWWIYTYIPNSTAVWIN